MIYDARGMLALKAKRFDDAIAAFSKSIDLQSTDDFSLRRRAIAYASSGNTKAAMADLDEAIKIYPAGAGEAYYLRMELFRMQGKYEQALEQIGPMMDAKPMRSAFYIAAAELYMQTDQREKAMNALYRGMGPAGDLDLYLYRAEMRLPSDQDGRQRDIDEALRLQPKSIRALRMRAELEYQKGEPRAAIATLSEAIGYARQPGGGTMALIDALVQRGAMHAKMGGAALAKADATMARQAADTASDLNEVAWQLASANIELATAMGTVREALKQKPNAPAYLDTEAFVLLRMGKYSAAVQQYNAALKGQPDSATSLFGRGIAKRRSGDRAGGDADLAAARKLQPSVAAKYARMGITL